MDVPPSAPRVVFYLSSLKSGGTEWFALRLAGGLKRCGFSPVFLVIRAEGELLREAEASFEVVKLPGGSYGLWGVARAFPATIRFLRQRRPTALISGLPLLNVALALAVKLSRTKPQLILVEHMRLEATKTVRNKLKRLFLSLAYRLADEVVSVSNAATLELVRLIGLDPGKTRTIYNPVIPDDFAKLASNPPPHPWLQNKTAPVLVSIGRLLPVKDYPTLLRAFADALKCRPLKLLIFGEGSERARLERMVRALRLEDSVALPGAVPNVFSALKAADLFVLSSTSESFGNVVAEALACGAKVVSTDCGGPREILMDGKLGALVPPRDPLALAKEMLRALDSSPDRAALEERGRSFSVETATRHYAEILRCRGI